MRRLRTARSRQNPECCFALFRRRCESTAIQACAADSGLPAAKAAFGEDVVGHYANMAKVELAASDQAVLAALFKGAEVDDYIGRADYGFITLDRVGKPTKGEWKLTEFDTLGQAVIECALADGKSRCTKLKNLHQK